MLFRNTLRSHLSRRLIPNTRVFILLLINFIFSLLYFSPSFLGATFNLIWTIAFVVLDEINALVVFNISDVREGFTSINVAAILNNEVKYNQALATAHNPPNQFEYIHFGFPRCPRNVHLLILIKSAAENIALRHTIRASWGRKDQRKYHIRFLLGSKQSFQKSIELESAMYGDIVQKDFTDEYSNNIFKTIMGFDWSVRYCGNAEFTLFVDDDHYINKAAILDYTSGLSNDTRRTLFVGYLLSNRRPMRDLGSKWSVYRSDYPYPRYPPYLAGGAFVVSKTVARRFLLVFPFVRCYRFDDVWLGIVAMAIGIEPMGYDRFYNDNYDVNINGRFLSHRKSHDPAEIVEIWMRNENV